MMKIDETSIWERYIQLDSWELHLRITSYKLLDKTQAKLDCFNLINFFYSERNNLLKKNDQST